MPVGLLKDPNAELIKTFLPPFKGTWKTIPPYLIPDDALQDSLNTSVLDGTLRSRCALWSFDTADIGNKVIGSFLPVNVSNGKTNYISTKNKHFHYGGLGNWVDDTNAVVLTATDNDAVRYTSLQIGTTIYTLYANGVDTLKIIDNANYLLNNITAYSGTIPVCKDICTSYSRFVGITPPYTVQWCDVINNTYLSFRNWPASNQVILADTEDPVIAIRPLGTLAFAVYKEGNIFIGYGQAGPNSTAFRFEHRGEYEGPAGVYSIVNVNGTHIYMTPTGRVGMFDGTQHSWIADGLWSFIQSEIERSYAYRIFGVYNYQTAEVYFWYPKTGDSGACKRMLIINLPYPSAGITSYTCFLGSVAFECTNALTVRPFVGPFWNDNFPVIYGKVGAVNRTFKLRKDEYLDDTTAFSCSATYGLYRPPTNGKDSDIYRPTYEIYASRDGSRGSLTVKSLTSYTLSTSGSEGQSEILNLTQSPINEYIAFNDTGSFIGIKLEWTSSARAEIKGIDVYGRATT